MYLILNVILQKNLNLNNYCEFNNPPSNYKLIGVITHIRDVCEWIFNCLLSRPSDSKMVYI